MNHANLLNSFFRLLARFHRTDLESFTTEHNRLYDEAKKTGDYTEAATHFYTVMADLLEAYYGSAWHFVPPESKGQSRDDALRGLHRRVAKLIGHAPGREALDLGCGIGSCMRGVALESGGRVTGITIGPNEVLEANALNRKANLDRLCMVEQGDFAHLPFEEERFDAAYAIYSYKYSPSLKEAFGEVHRVLKPGGLFLIYDMVKAETFDATDPEHVRLLDFFAYACGMPPIHSNRQRVDEANVVGFECMTEMDLSQEFTWYDHFLHPPILMKLFESKRVLALIGRAEGLGLLPRGFAKFYEIFVAGNVVSMVNGGKQGALTGSNLVVLRKPVDAD